MQFSVLKGKFATVKVSSVTVPYVSVGATEAKLRKLWLNTGIDPIFEYTGNEYG